MMVHAEGSLPGTDMRSVLQMIAGEAASAFFLPVLPARGLPATAVGRMTALLPDMVWGYGVRTFVCGPQETRFHRAARSLLEQDMDLLEEIVETTGTGSGPLTVVVAGPVACLSHVELPNGHWMLTDTGAVCDLMDQYVEMVAQLARDLSRRTGRDPWVVMDEGDAGPALSGTLPGAHRWEHIPMPDQQILPAQWSAVGEAMPGRVVLRLPHESTQWVRQCAPALWAGTLRVALPVSLQPSTAQRDEMGELLDQWGGGLECVMPLVVPQRERRQHAHRLAVLLRDLAVAPQESSLPSFHDSMLCYTSENTHGVSLRGIQECLGSLVEMPELVLDEWPQ